jgi:Flp pilus assembly protein TadD
LQIVRGEPAQEIGRVIVSTVFRERARGRVVSTGKIQVRDGVRASTRIHLDALMQQVDALSAQGESAAAQVMAKNAVEWAQAEKASASEMSTVLERLGSLEFQAGLFDSSEKHFEAALAGSTANPALLNSLAVLHLLRGDRGGAESPLRQAVSVGLGTGTVYVRIMNNLGVEAELRGDRQKAQSFYSDAQRALAAIPSSPEQDRRAIEANLARIRGSR